MGMAGSAGKNDLFNLLPLVYLSIFDLNVLKLFMNKKKILFAPILIF